MLVGNIRYAAFVIIMKSLYIATMRHEQATRNQERMHYYVTGKELITQSPWVNFVMIM